MRLIDADEIVYESIDSCDTGRHESYYGTGILAVRKEDIDDMPIIEGQFIYPTVEQNTNGDWVMINKQKILQAGYEGQEIDFRIGGRLFAIREKAQ